MCLEQNNTRCISAKLLFDLIVEHAWNNGEPGMVWLDRMNEDNFTPNLGEIKATNPCGEEPLLHREQCCLGSINVANFVRDDTFDWNRLQKTIASSVRFLDNVIDAQSYATPEIEEMNKKTRKIGLGVMGWADALVKLNIPYDSVIALELADELMCFFKEHTTKTSQSLGLEKGSFLAFPESKYHCDAMRNSWGDVNCTNWYYFYDCWMFIWY